MSHDTSGGLRKFDPVNTEKAVASENIRVAVRVRPSSQFPRDQLHSPVNGSQENHPGIEFPDPGSVVVRKGGKRWDFSYSNVFCKAQSSDEVYKRVCADLVPSVATGYPVTVFVYGQTGTGKTFTVNGILPCILEDLYRDLESKQPCLVRASFLEIYNESIKDLISGEDDLDLRDDGVAGLTWVNCQNKSQIIDIVKRARRVTARTNMNDTSSRSHAILSLRVERPADQGGAIVVGTLNLVDLAGSERQRKTGTQGIRLKEAAKINWSLSVLGTCIAKLARPSAIGQHIPYRDSKLTRLLRDALGGHSKTAMIATVSQDCSHVDETLSTLRYASRASLIQNKPRVNQDPRDALLLSYLEEIQRLRQRLGNATSAGSPSNDTVGNTALKREMQKTADLRRRLEELQGLCAVAAAPISTAKNEADDIDRPQSAMSIRLPSGRPGSSLDDSTVERYIETLQSRIEDLKAKLGCLESEAYRERLQVTAEWRTLSTELSLYTHIAEIFVPWEERLKWSEDDDDLPWNEPDEESPLCKPGPDREADESEADITWSVDPFAHSLLTTPSLAWESTPPSALKRIIQGDENPRYRPFNPLSLPIYDGNEDEVVSLSDEVVRFEVVNGNKVKWWMGWGPKASSLSESSKLDSQAARSRNGKSRAESSRPLTSYSIF